jgi:quinoprotein glucose dehydrogenase
MKLVFRYKLGPIYTPAVVSKWDGPLATLILPSNNGGANWPGGAVDPETGIRYIYSFSQISAHALISDPSVSDMEYVHGTARNPSAGPAPARGAGGGGRAAGAGARGGGGRAGGGGGGGGEEGGGTLLLVQGFHW